MGACGTSVLKDKNGNLPGCAIDVEANIRTKQRALPKCHHGAVYGNCFLNVEEILTWGEDGCLSITSWYTHPAKTKWYQHVHHKAITKAVYHQTSATVTSASRDGSIAIWNLPQTHTVFAGTDTASASKVRSIPEAHNRPVTGLATSQTGKTIASGGRDAVIKVWDVETGVALQSASLENNMVTSIKWDPSSESAVFAQSSEDLHVYLWDSRLSPLRPAQAISGFVYFPLTLDFTIDGLQLAVGNKGFQGVGCEVRLYDRRTCTMRQEFRGHAQDVTGVTFLKSNAESISIASCSKDGTVKIWSETSASSTEAEYTDFEDDGTPSHFTDISAVAVDASKSPPLSPGSWSSSEDDLQDKSTYLCLTSYGGTTSILGVSSSLGSVGTSKLSVDDRKADAIRCLAKTFDSF